MAEKRRPLPRINMLQSMLAVNEVRWSGHAQVKDEAGGKKAWRGWHASGDSAAKGEMTAGWNVSGAKCT